MTSPWSVKMSQFGALVAAQSRRGTL
jgi:hypothetical protein